MQDGGNTYQIICMPCVTRYAVREQRAGIGRACSHPLSRHGTALRRSFSIPNIRKKNMLSDTQEQKRMCGLMRLNGQLHMDMIRY